MISRVWKRTLYKLAKAVGFIVGILAYIGTGMYVGYHFFGSTEGGMAGFYVAGFIAYIVHIVYQQSKREIEYENDKLMRELKLDEAKRKLNGL